MAILLKSYSFKLTSKSNYSNFQILTDFQAALFEQWADMSYIDTFCVPSNVGKSDSVASDTASIDIVPKGQPYFLHRIFADCRFTAFIIGKSSNQMIINQCRWSNSIKAVVVRSTALYFDFAVGIVSATGPWSSSFAITTKVMEKLLKVIF